MISSKEPAIGAGYIKWTIFALTNDDEGVIDVNTSKAIGCFADVRPGVICLHLFDLQAHAEDTEANPAAVDVVTVFGPHD